MLVDFFVPTHDTEGASLGPDELVRAAEAAGVQAVVLVGDGSVPAADSALAVGLADAGIRAFRGAMLNVGEACLWVLPPEGDFEIPPTDGAEASDVVRALGDQGAAVLLCNPYARGLPGGQLRDKAAFVKGVHGVLGLVAAADLQENLLGQELAMVLEVCAAGGSALAPGKKGFASCLTLATTEGDDVQALIDTIRMGRCLAVESATGELRSIEVTLPPRGGPRRDRGGDRGGRGGRGDRGGRGGGRRFGGR